MLAVSEVGVALDGERVESSLLAGSTLLLQFLAGKEYDQRDEFDDAEYKEVPALVAAAVDAGVTDGTVGVAVAILGGARLWALGFGRSKEARQHAARLALAASLMLAVRREDQRRAIASYPAWYYLMKEFSATFIEEYDREGAAPRRPPRWPTRDPSELALDAAREGAAARAQGGSSCAGPSEAGAPTAQREPAPATGPAAPGTSSKAAGAAPPAYPAALHHWDSNIPTDQPSLHLGFIGLGDSPKGRTGTGSARPAPGWTPGTTGGGRRVGALPSRASSSWEAAAPPPGQHQHGPQTFEAWLGCLSPAEAAYQRARAPSPPRPPAPQGGEETDQSAVRRWDRGPGAPLAAVRRWGRWSSEHVHMYLRGWPLDSESVHWDSEGSAVLGDAPLTTIPDALPGEEEGGEPEYGEEEGGDIWRWCVQAASEQDEEDDPSPLDLPPSSTVEGEEQEVPSAGTGSSPPGQNEKEDSLDEAGTLGVPAPMPLPYELMYPVQAARFIPPTAEEIAEARRAVAAGDVGGATLGRAEDGGARPPPSFPAPVGIAPPGVPPPVLPPLPERGPLPFCAVCVRREAERHAQSEAEVQRMVEERVLERLDPSGDLRRGLLEGDPWQEAPAPSPPARGPEEERNPEGDVGRSPEGDLEDGGRRRTHATSSDRS